MLGPVSQNEVSVLKVSPYTDTVSATVQHSQSHSDAMGTEATSAASGGV